MTCQLCPSSVERCTNWEQWYNVRGSCGENRIGAFQLKRYLRSRGACPTSISAYAMTLRHCPVRRLRRVISPP
jgi:hypothetical protein